MDVPQFSAEQIAEREVQIIQHMAQMIQSTQSADYGRYGPWLAQTKSLHWSRLISGNGIPGLQAKHFLHLKFAPKSRMTLPLSLTALQLNHNGSRVRGFDLDRGLCLKVVRDEGGVGATQRAEIALRAKVAGLNCVRLPQITHVEDQNGILFLKEELIQGRRFSLRRDYQLFINQLPQLAKMWRGLGVSEQRLSDVVWHNPNTGIASLDQALTQAFAANPLVPVAQLHGDLIPSNLCVSNGQLVLLDWDRSKKAAVLDDLIPLAVKGGYGSTQVLGASLELMRQEFGLDTQSLRHLFAATLANHCSAKRVKNVQTLWDFGQKFLG